MRENIFINPGVIVKHNWKKLRAMGKAVNADNKAALTRFTLSGTHDSNFFSLCNGKLQAYYLGLILMKGLSLTEWSKRTCPLDVFLLHQKCLNQ